MMTLAFIPCNIISNFGKTRSLMILMKTKAGFLFLARCARWFVAQNHAGVHAWKLFGKEQTFSKGTLGWWLDNPPVYHRLSRTTKWALPVTPVGKIKPLQPVVRRLRTSFPCRKDLNAALTLTNYLALIISIYANLFWSSHLKHIFSCRRILRGCWLDPNIPV